jgi:ribosome-associated translation inhibitor RaiA
MKISVRWPDYGSSKMLPAYVNTKLAGLGKLSVHATAVDVRLRHDANGGLEDKVCEIYLKLAEKNIFTCQKGRSFEESTLKAVNKLISQVTKAAEGNPGSAGPATNG